MNFQRGAQRNEPEISLIPLIDVVLVIIIFLMLTTTFSRVSGLEINLPTADGEQREARVDEISVAVTPDGEVRINGEPVGSREVADIADALRRSRSADAGDPVVIINADAEASHQRVIDVMQAAQRAGLPTITFAIQSPAHD